jgi:NarL family two-component system response regulator YdfI
VIRIGIVAPIPAVRAGLRAMLVKEAASINQFNELELSASAASIEEIEPYIPQLDVLIITEDVMSKSTLQRLLQEAQGQIALLLLADTPQATGVLPDLPLRAWGIISIDSSLEELQAGIQALSEGLVVGTPTLLEPGLRRLLVLDDSESIPENLPLTEREGQVLQLMARGLANKQIALELGISEHTVKFHISSIYTKLGVTNRTEAVRVGVHLGLILL